MTSELAVSKQSAGMMLSYETMARPGLAYRDTGKRARHVEFFMPLDCTEQQAIDHAAVVLTSQSRHRVPDDAVLTVELEQTGLRHDDGEGHWSDPDGLPVVTEVTATWEWQEEPRDPAEPPQSFRQLVMDRVRQDLARRIDASIRQQQFLGGSELR